MKVSLKREIVRRFKAGETCFNIASDINPSRGLWEGPLVADIEAVIRDVMNGKFQLEAAPKRRRLSIKMLPGFPCGMVEIVEPKKRKKA